VEINPRYAPAHLNLGAVLALRGSFDDAIAHYRLAIAARPDDAAAHNNLGSLFVHLKRAAEANEQLGEALRIKPSYPEAHYNMARLRLQQGQPRDAFNEFEEALRLRPSWPAVLSEYGWLRATHPDASLRNSPKAIELAEHAVELTGRQEPVPLDVLAAAYASASRFDEAIHAARAALSLLAGDDPAGRVPGLRQRLALYEQRKPFVERPVGSRVP
jgi:tetratricopeptide (TPR) repeat protein